jgi:hypothetical protein
MLLEPLGYHVGKTVISEISPVNDAESAVIKLLAGDHFQGPPVSLAFPVDRERRLLDTARLVQP